MNIECTDIQAVGKKFHYSVGGKEMARAYLYVLSNDMRDRPFGFMEDVFVDESLRGQGIGSELVKMVIEEARRQTCYKLVCTSRYEKQEVHALYAKLGFVDHGKEMRVDF